MPGRGLSRNVPPVGRPEVPGKVPVLHRLPQVGGRFIQCYQFIEIDLLQAVSRHYMLPAHPAEHKSFLYTHIQDAFIIMSFTFSTARSSPSR